MLKFTLPFNILKVASWITWDEFTLAAKNMSTKSGEKDMFRIKKSRTVSGLLKNTETGRSVEEENEMLITYITRHESTK